MKAASVDFSPFKYSEDNEGTDTSSFSYSLQGIFQSLMDAVLKLTRAITSHVSSASDAVQLSRRGPPAPKPPATTMPNQKIGKKEFGGADTGDAF